MVSARIVLVCALGVAAGCGSEPINPFAGAGNANASSGRGTSDTNGDTTTTDNPTTGISISASASASAGGTSDGSSGSTMGRDVDGSSGSTGSDSGSTAAVIDTEGDGSTSTTSSRTTDVPTDAGSSSSSGGSTSTGMVDPTEMTTVDPTMGTTGTTTSGGSTSTGSCDPIPTDYDDCFNSGNGVCDTPDSTCLLNDTTNPSHGTCSALNCVDDCDCPVAPGTGTAVSTCGDILAGGGTACYLDCSGAAMCPDGMECIANTLCMWPDLICDDPPPAGDYADCITEGTAACNNLSATCLQDDTTAPTFGVCAPQGCDTDCDCPAAPATGDATVSCGSIVEGGGNACFLSCSAGETCPNGMTCFDDFLCMWMP